MLPLREETASSQRWKYLNQEKIMITSVYKPFYQEKGTNSPIYKSLYLFINPLSEFSLANHQTFKYHFYIDVALGFHKSKVISFRFVVSSPNFPSPFTDSYRFHLAYNNRSIQ
jgi:hypothetical protein